MSQLAVMRLDSPIDSLKNVAARESRPRVMSLPYRSLPGFALITPGREVRGGQYRTAMRRGSKSTQFRANVGQTVWQYFGNRRGSP